MGGAGRAVDRSVRVVLRFYKDICTRLERGSSQKPSERVPGLFGDSESVCPCLRKPRESNSP